MVPDTHQAVGQIIIIHAHTGTDQDSLTVFERAWIVTNVNV